MQAYTPLAFFSALVPGVSSGSFLLLHPRTAAAGSVFLPPRVAAGFFEVGSATTDSGLAFPLVARVGLRLVGGSSLGSKVGEALRFTPLAGVLLAASGLLAIVAYRR